jgi:hypothetical protein
VLRDFNVAASRDERKGLNEGASACQVVDMNIFNSFVRGVELEDLNVLGKRFTWYHPNGRSMSRIDRVLIS